MLARKWTQQCHIVPSLRILAGTGNFLPFPRIWTLSVSTHEKKVRWRPEALCHIDTLPDLQGYELRSPKFDFLEGRKAQMLILGSSDPILCLLRMWKDDSKRTTSEPRGGSSASIDGSETTPTGHEDYCCWSLTSKGLTLNCSRTTWPAFTIVAPFLLEIVWIWSTGSASIGTVCRGLQGRTIHSQQQFIASSRQSNV